MNSGRKSLQVLYRGRDVGILAETADHLIAFQYSDSWLASGFSVSPFSLPLKKTVFLPANRNFDGLFGVFADSLPDAWGKLLVDRMLQKHQIDPNSLNVLDRLALTGDHGMGALTYKPCYQWLNDPSEQNLDALAAACSEILEAKNSDISPDVLFSLGGSSGGARAKVFLQMSDGEWLIKFPFRLDGADSGLREYEYALLAKACKIPMTETRLFPSQKCPGYFGTRRFDRPKVHVLSAAAALEVDFEGSFTDYRELLKLTKILTHENQEAIQDMFRRMCFNVFGENQDDHLKNFSFLFNEAQNAWQLSPAYDLTRCKTAFGEHTTTVNGRGKNIGEDDLMTVGMGAGLEKDFCRQIISEIRKVFEDYQQGRMALE